MKRFYVTFLSLICCFSIFAINGLNIANLRIGMRENPEGMAISKVRFSWQINTQMFDVVQTAYKIEVATSADNIKAEKYIWQSNITKSSESNLIPYTGTKLQNGKDYYWRVTVWTNKGKAVSQIAKWSTALNESDWKASWIGINDSVNFKVDAKHRTSLPARYLRKEFNIRSKVKRVMLYIAGLGSSVTYINGKPVSDDVFGSIPSWYPKTVYYNTYNITDLLNQGNNAIGVILGNGRFVAMRQPGMRGFGLPKLCAQIEVEYENGEHTTITTDTSWMATNNGPIKSNNEYDGEEYIATNDLGDWTKTGYDATSSWRKAQLMENPQGKLTPQPSPCIKVKEIITPISVKAVPGGKYILDMGQNMVGWLKISSFARRNKPITLRFAETLKDNGTELYVDNLRSAKATDVYMQDLDMNFTWEPTFTYHGFRYVEVSGLEEMPPLTAFQGKVIYDDMATTGTFETNNKIANQIFKNAYWGIRGNYRGMPTDCPQRDERLGWLGDRSIGSFGESFIFDNQLLYSKWVKDMEDCINKNGLISDVSPAYWGLYKNNITWPSTFFYIPKMLYYQYGDDSPIKDHYIAMKKWIKHIIETSLKDNIIIKDVYGDWCMPPESLELIHSKDPSRITKGEILSTTFFYDILNTMKLFAKISGHTEDIKEYTDFATKIKEAYNNKFFNKEKGCYDNNTVTGNLISLRYGLVPNGYEKQIFKNITEKTEVDCKGHVSVGVIGIQQLMRGLTQYGNVDLAYKILTNDTYPSWGYMAKQGATTIWELWNGNTANPSMNSGNHVMLLGDLIIWMYEDLAGIKNNPSSIGFKKILMKPYFPNGLNEVNASHETPYGWIKSAWKRNGNDLTWNITIPANSTANIELPSTFNVKIAKQPGVHKIKYANGKLNIEIGSGQYTFKSAK